MYGDPCEESDLHLLVDALAGAPALDLALYEVSTPHPQRGRHWSALVLAPLGAHSLLSGRGRPQQQEGDVRRSMGLKSQTATFQRERRVRLDTFVSDLKVAVSWRKKKMAMSMNEWQLVGLSRYYFEGEVLVKLERTVRE